MQKYRLPNLRFEDLVTLQIDTVVLDAPLVDPPGLRLNCTLLQSLLSFRLLEEVVSLGVVQCSRGVHHRVIVRRA